MEWWRLQIWWKDIDSGKSKLMSSWFYELSIQILPFMSHQFRMCNAWCNISRTNSKSLGLPNTIKKCIVSCLKSHCTELAHVMQHTISVNDLSLMDWLVHIRQWPSLGWYTSLPLRRDSELNAVIGLWLL
jgi:hypothetical protein